MALPDGYFFLFFVLFLVTLAQSFVHHIDDGPILMIKLAKSYDTKSFIDGQWTEAQEFEDSKIGQILSKCENPQYDCWSHDAGIMENNFAEPNTMANVVFINNKRKETENYFCATTWPEFAKKCTVLVDDVGECARSLSVLQQQSFMCFALPKDEMIDFIKAFYGAIHMFTKDDPGVLEYYNGGFLIIGLMNPLPYFSNRTGVIPILQRPIKGAPEDQMDDLRTKQNEDSYQHFAEVVSTDMMVMTCTKKGAPIFASFHGLGDPMVFNTRDSFHPLFKQKYLENGDCLDNTKLAVNIPKNKDRDPYYVCFGDLPRDLTGQDNGGGLYCWENKELNRDLRCNIVPNPLRQLSHQSKHMSVYLPALFAENEYREWYADCPEQLKKPVLESLKKEFEEAKKTHKEAEENNWNDEL